MLLWGSHVTDAFNWAYRRVPGGFQYSGRTHKILGVLWMALGLLITLSVLLAK